MNVHVTTNFRYVNEKSIDYHYQSQSKQQQYESWLENVWSERKQSPTTETLNRMMMKRLSTSRNSKLLRLQALKQHQQQRLNAVQKEIQAISSPTAADAYSSSSRLWMSGGAAAAGRRASLPSSILSSSTSLEPTSTSSLSSLAAGGGCNMLSRSSSVPSLMTSSSSVELASLYHRREQLEEVCSKLRSLSPSTLSTVSSSSTTTSSPPPSLYAEDYYNGRSHHHMNQVVDDRRRYREQQELLAASVKAKIKTPTTKVVVAPSLLLLPRKTTPTSTKKEYSNKTWDQMYERLLKYKQIYGHCRVLKNYKEDTKLGHWVATQRRQRSNNNLSTDRVERLDSIGFIWTCQKDVWNSMYERLLKYKQKHGHCRVLKDDKSDPKLGFWVANQRRNRSNLSKERIDKLEALDFVWLCQKDTWFEMFERLVEYKAYHGNCLVPHRYKDDTKLGSWVSTQRTAFKTNMLSIERYEQLNSIGFVWKTTGTKQQDKK